MAAALAAALVILAGCGPVNPPPITVDDDVLGVAEGWEDSYGFPFSDTSIVVIAEDVEAAATALQRAGRRFSRVLDDGRELEEGHPTLSSDEFYTPNYVTDVRLSPSGPYIAMDYKGELIPEPARVTFISIVVEELERAGIHEARVVPGDAERVEWPVLKALYPDS